MTPYLLLFPAFLYLAMSTYRPMAQAPVSSLYQWRSIDGEGDFTGLGNYRCLLAVPIFCALLNTGLFEARTVIPGIAPGFLFALAMRRSGAASNLFRALLFFPMLIQILGTTFVLVSVIKIVTPVIQVYQAIVMIKGAPNNAANLLLFYINRQAHEF